MKCVVLFCNYIYNIYLYVCNRYWNLKLLKSTNKKGSKLLKNILFIRIRIIITFTILHQFTNEIMVYTVIIYGLNYMNSANGTFIIQKALYK